MAYLLLIILGLILGSFVNALVWRLHEQNEYYDDEGTQKKLTKSDKKRLKELSISKGRSMCSKCGHPLSPLDLIPLFSWVFLRGKCRYCKQKIDDTPLIEIALPILLVISYWLWPFNLQSISDFGLYGIWVGMMTCFVALAAYDAKWYLLPDKIVAPLTVLAASFVLLRTYISGDLTVLIQALAAAVVISGLFMLLYVVSKGTWIGFGDVKLAVSLGLIVGTPLFALLVIFVASLLGTFAALPHMINSGKGLKQTLPFGPYLLLGAFIVFLFGNQITAWYFNLLMG